MNDQKFWAVLSGITELAEDYKNYKHLPVKFGIEKTIIARMERFVREYRGETIAEPKPKKSEMPCNCHKDLPQIVKDAVEDVKAKLTDDKTCAVIIFRVDELKKGDWSVQERIDSDRFPKSQNGQCRSRKSF